jgi:hypothetical protein
VHWDNAEIESKYSEYVNIMPATGIITIRPATDVTLPEGTSLEQVQFTARITTSRIVMESTSIFYFNSNPDYADTQSSDVTLALTDINSISFFVNWGGSIK